MNVLQSIRTLITELRRRHVFKVAAVYIAVSWAVIEGANTVVPRLNIPDWTVTLVIVLAMCGLPLTLVFAWAYDLTPDGVRRTEPAASSVAFRIAPAALLLLMAVSVGAGFAARSLREPVAASASERSLRSIAVLPFQNAGANVEDEYLSEGIAEELMHRLSRIPDLQVAARTSSFAFRDGPADVREIGQRLQVDVVLEGSVRSVGSRLRVSARLVSTADGYQLWSEVYEHESSDIFRLQDEISSAIVERLRPDSPSGGSALPADVLETADAESHEALELYMKGRYEWGQRTEDGLRAAVRYYEQAIARSPRFARAHLGLAQALAVLGFYDYVAPGQAFAYARESARRALDLDPAQPEAHATLAYVSLYHDYDFVAAEEGFRRAIALDPRNATSRQWYGNLLTAMGRFDEAAREMRIAQQLDPYALIGHAASGWISMYARQYDDAIAQIDNTLQRDSTYFLAVLWKGEALRLSGELEPAVVQLRRALRIAPHSVLAEAALARALAATGDTTEARQMLTALEVRSAREYASSYEIALVHLALGDRDSALGRLERAAAERAHALALLNVDPHLDQLRNEPRFDRIRETIGISPAM